MGTLLMVLIGVFLTALSVRIGVDYSHNRQHTKEILQELREIKQYLKSRNDYDY
ncbi:MULTISPECIES: hypothetical protein [unclassified Paenibacillus]|uniref:hypothetical protein n=1 Tax=unclassified Paenibacillus TaxID=185978 RepID=UPI002F40B046